MSKEKMLNRIPKVICIEATESDYPEFLATHIPFRNLLYKDILAGDKTGKEIDEETFYRDRFIKNLNRHNFILFKGHNGCGKSHEIRWVYERFRRYVDMNNLNESILFISRFQNTLKGTLEQIINSGIFSEESQKEDLRKLMNASQSLNNEGINKSILLKFADLCLTSQEINEDEYDEDFREEAFAFLTDINVIELLGGKNGPIERIRSKLNVSNNEKRAEDIEPIFYPEDFKGINIEFLKKMKNSSIPAKSFAQGLCDKLIGDENKSSFVKLLNMQIDRVIQGYTNLTEDDMKDIFNKLRKELKKQGKNLTIFVEDITSFTGINKGLINVLATTHLGVNNENLCRLTSVIGITNKYYENYFPTGIESRVTAIVEMDNAMLTNEQEIGEMAARYINAINLDNSDLKTWADNGGNDAELPVYEGELKHEWANITISNGKRLSLFPFNLRALITMFNNLNEKNPRRFLQGVLWNVLQKYASEPEAFPKSTKEFGGEFTIPELNPPYQRAEIESQSKSAKDKVLCLLLLWGEKNANRKEENGKVFVGGLGEEVFKAFNAPVIPGIETGTKPNPKPEPKPESGPVPGPKPGPEPEPEPVVINKQFENTRLELESWTRESNGKISKYGEGLLDNLIPVIKTAIDWESYDIPYTIANDYINKNTLWIEGSIVENKKGFMVPRNEESKYALMAIAAWMHLGNKSWNFDDSVVYLDYLYKWIESNKEDILNSVRGPKGHQKDWAINRWSLINEVYILAFQGKLSGSESREEIYKAIIERKESDFNVENHSTNWASLLNDFNSMKDIIKLNHEVLLKQYSCTQGKAATSSVYIMDAAEMLNVISEMKKTNWDISSIVTPDISIDRNMRNNKWYTSLYILQRLSKAVKLVAVEEDKYVKQLLSKLEGYFGKDYSVDDVIKVLERINSFLENLKNKYHIPFIQNDYAVLSKDIQKISDEVIKARYNLNIALKAVNPIDKLHIYSGEFINNIIPIIEMLKHAESLVNNLKKEYEDKFKNKPKVDVAKVKEELRKEIVKIMAEFEVICEKREVKQA